MKMIIVTLMMMAAMIIEISAITLQDAFKTIAQLPDIKDVRSGISTDLKSEWLEGLSLDKAVVAYKAHEIGSEQTIYYGNKVMDVVKQLPTENLILSAANSQNLFYIYSKPISEYKCEILILIDMAY